MYLDITILCYYIINIMAKAAKPGDTSLHKLSQAGLQRLDIGQSWKNLNLLSKVGDQIPSGNLT